MTRMQKQAERFGAKTSYGTVEKTDFSKSPFELIVDGETMQAETVIIATGAGHKHLNVPGEDILETKGVTYCATCDGALPIFRKKPLVVVGGGDSACEEALYLTRFGSEVFLVHRRDSLRASKIMAERVHAHQTIKPVWDSVVTEVLGVENGAVTGVRLKNVKTGAESVLNCAGVFVAIGHIPNTTIFKGQIEMDANGFVIRKEGSRTSVPGVFVAGDVRAGSVKRVASAVGEGSIAVQFMHQYLAGF
jgi:thioredoxin reductase (NADPH)